MPKSILFDKEKVMQNVIELFWKKGYNGTSMQDLVDATGLNRSSFYNSFGDKFSLFEASLKYYQEQQYNWLTKTCNEGKTPKEAIVSLFKGIIDDIKENGQKGCMLTSCTSEMSHDPRVKEFLIDNKDRVVSTFESLILKSQHLGELPKEKNAKVLALYLFSNLQGLRITSMIDDDLEEVVNEILRFF